MNQQIVSSSKAKTLRLLKLTEEQKSAAEKLLARVVAWIVHGSSWNVRAVILLGSVPSGWGSSAHSDLDVMVVTRTYDPLLPYRARRALRGVVTPCRVEVSQWPMALFKRSRSVSVYDIRKTGVILYGNDEVLKTVSNWKEIPRYEALRYLFNIAVVNLVSSFTMESFTTEEGLGNPSEETIYQCYKAYLASCAALLILGGEYRTGYEDRRRHFESLYRERYWSLHEDIPDLATKVAFATDFKLGKASASSTDLSRIADQTLSDVSKIMKYCLKQYFVSGEDDAVALLKLLKRFPRNKINRIYYLQRYLSTFLRPPPLRSLLVEPITSLYIAAGCLLLAAESRNLTVFLDTAIGEVCNIYSPFPRQRDAWENWDSARKTCKFLLPERLLTPQWRYCRDPIPEAA